VHFKRFWNRLTLEVTKADEMLKSFPYYKIRYKSTQYGLTIKGSTVESGKSGSRNGFVAQNG
jgi:hypothetical protein